MARKGIYYNLVESQGGADVQTTYEKKSEEYLDDETSRGQSWMLDEEDLVESASQTILPAILVRGSSIRKSGGKSAEIDSSVNSEEENVTSNSTKIQYHQVYFYLL